MRFGRRGAGSDRRIRDAALPGLDANGAAVAIESLTLQNEGWERDVNVVEPQEP